MKDKPHLRAFFARYYDRLIAPLERWGLAGLRKNLVSKAWGKVLEIGAGTGLNFPYYRKQQVELVVALEPNPVMRKKALARANQASVPIAVVEGDAQDLPFPDETFDTVVGTLVFCTIPDPFLALREVRRVCKSNGRILLLEHVRGDHPLLGRVLDWATPVWRRLCDGCHLNRDTLALVERAGLCAVQLEKHAKGLLLGIEVRKQGD